MKFVCERCHTKYSIADEKVRGKVLKVRCKSCEHVITVRESGATIDEPAAAGASKEAPMSRSGTLAAAGRAAAAPAAAARPRRPSGALPAAAFHDGASPAVAPPTRRSIPTPVPTPPPVVDDGIEWYLAVDGAQTGPFARGVLVAKILAVPPGGDIHVWNAVLGDWKPPTEVADLHADIQRRKRPLPTPAHRPPAPRPGPGALAKAAGSNGVSHAGGEGHGEHAEMGSGHAGKQNGVADFPSSDTVVARAPNGFGLEDLFGGDEGAPASVAGSAVGAAVAVPGVPTSVTTSPSQSQPVVLGAGLATPSVGGGGTVGLGARSGRQLKLIGGAVALVVILCGIVAVAVLRKPSAPAVAAPQPQPPQTDFSDLAAKLAKEEAEKNRAPAPAVAPPAVAPVVEAKSPLAKVDTKDAAPKSGRGRVTHGKKGGLGTTPTSPPPVGGMTPEQIQAAHRFAEASGREVKAPSSSASSARSTPAQADISRVINNNRQGIQTCYQRALLRDSTLTQGKVTVRVSIGLSGKVKSVSLDAPLPFRSMEPCVRDVMSRWAFPPSSEEYGTEFPVVLQGNQ